jgi:hypothetical protein
MLTEFRVRADAVHSEGRTRCSNREKVSEGIRLGTNYKWLNAR